MIFLGDVAHPFVEPPVWCAGLYPWQPQPVSVNLEGPIIRGRPVDRKVLFNHYSILPALRSLGVVVANIGNNHINDFQNGAVETIDNCSDVGIRCFGAGKTAEFASQPAILLASGVRVVLFAWGWKTIGCKGAAANRPGVNLFDPELILDQVTKARIAYPDAYLVCQFHWNYEMELYPQPAHRQLAFAVIDAGADAVVGHHPHRVGGFERYKRRPIAYSLGNWWLPQGVFWGGALRYEEASRVQLALELDMRGGSVAHRFDYSPDNHSLVHCESTPADDSLWLQSLTPFAGMPHDEYVRWFSRHRVKNKLLPTYSDYQHRTGNLVRDKFVAIRHVGVVGIKSALALMSGKKNRRER